MFLRSRYAFLIFMGVLGISGFTTVEVRAGIIGFDLQIANPTISIFRLQNTSLDLDAEITAFRGSIGDTTYNFDIVTVVGPLVDTGNLLTHSLTLGDTMQDGVRTDEFALSFSGFEIGDRFQIQTDIDIDSANTIEDFRNVFFNNGGAPNAQFTVHFRSGAELGSLTLTVPDDPLIGDPQVFNFSVSGTTAAVPEPSSCTMFCFALAFALFKRRRVKSAKSGKDAPFGTPSPHHRTCGSAYGGSTKRSKFRPQSL